MAILRRSALWVFGVLCLATSTQASALLIGLNTLSTNVSDGIIISGDGLSATFYEDPIYSPVALWDSGLPIPADSEILSFDYELKVATNNSDYFDFYLGDLASPIFSVGGTAGAIEPLLFGGTYTTDVSLYADSNLPLAFSLIYDWGDAGLDSTLTISNLEIIEKSVPEPATLALLAVGLLIVTLFASRRMQ